MDAASVRIKGFELSVTGYEFPEISASASTYDANWLIVNAEIQTASGGIRLRDEACLLTWELKDLAEQLNWLSQPQLHGRWRADLKAMEPTLKLHFSQDDSGLFFGAEITVYESNVLESHRAQWPIEASELDVFRQQLDEVLRAFPIKASS